MPASLMYYEDHYVVLPPDMQERFVNQTELLALLEELLANIQDDLPRDLQDLPHIPDQAKRLCQTACDLDCGDHGVWQWYAVRLER
ncbi:MAG: chlororespiratory reduction protein 7 [Pseudanabaenaceae cyanobacterium]|jgi:hypothetical protein